MRSMAQPVRLRVSLLHQGKRRQPEKFEYETDNSNAYTQKEQGKPTWAIITTRNWSICGEATDVVLLIGRAGGGDTVKQLQY